MVRGNGCQNIVCDDVDRDRFLEHLGRAAIRCSWRFHAIAIMSNHLHVVLKTPQSNLSRGMQSFLSAYLARSRTMSTNAELAMTLGLSCAECVPNLTRRFAALLATNARVRRNLEAP
jgi:REP element-mobilizing transposase RayT